MRKETENGNFDRPCFAVQTVYLRTLLTEVASEGWNKPCTQCWAEVCALDEWMCTLWHKWDKRHWLQISDERETWWNWQNLFDSVCRELFVGWRKMGVNISCVENFDPSSEPSVVDAKWDR